MLGDASQKRKKSSIVRGVIAALFDTVHVHIVYFRLQFYVLICR